MEEDSKEKILKDWNNAQDIEKFDSFGELRKCIKYNSKRQGVQGRHTGIWGNKPSKDTWKTRRSVKTVRSANNLVRIFRERIKKFSKLQLIREDDIK